MSNREQYRNFCESGANIGIFSQPFMLDILYGTNNWDCALVTNNNRVIASLPYAVKSKFVFSSILKPLFVPYTDLFIDYPDNLDYARKLSFEKKIVNQLLEQMPEVDFFKMNITSNLTSWMPFYWNGFRQTTRYTYKLSNVNNEHELIEGYSSDAKRFIKKAGEKVIVEKGLRPEKFYELVEMSFKRQNKKCPYPRGKFIRIHEEIVKKNIGDIFYAKDSLGQVHSAMSVFWFNGWLTFFMEGNDSRLRNSNAKYLINDHVLKLAVKKGLNIDFEGSMLESVEHVYRQFGGELTSYYELSKYKTKFHQLVWNLIKE